MSKILWSMPTFEKMNLSDNRGRDEERGVKVGVVLEPPIEM